HPLKSQVLRSYSGFSWHRFGTASLRGMIWHYMPLCKLFVEVRGGSSRSAASSCRGKTGCPPTSRNPLISETGSISEAVMDFLKVVPLLVGILCVTMLGVFGSGELGWSALSLLSVLLLRPRL